ncbi:unnamed protein product [Rhizophagus irregularis]|nr:unnamed protein product [Rhizophagus irregularis]
MKKSDSKRLNCLNKSHLFLLFFKPFNISNTFSVLISEILLFSTVLFMLIAVLTSTQKKRLVLFHFGNYSDLSMVLE